MFTLSVCLWCVLFQGIRPLWGIPHSVLSCSSVSDRGGGIPHHLVQRVFDYHYTSPAADAENSSDNDVFGHLMSPDHGGPSAGPMHG